MKTRQIIGFFFLFILFLALQVFFFRNVAIYEAAFCFIYTLFILLLPLETPALVVIILGFAMGLSVDIFYNSPGLHAAATTLMAFARQGVINALTPSGGYDPNAKPVVSQLGFKWVMIYGLLLLALHHATVFIIESSSFQFLGRALTVTVFSLLFTLFVHLVVQYLFYSSKGRRR